jgi:hypothetical protein
LGQIMPAARGGMVQSMSACSRNAMAVFEGTADEGRDSIIAHLAAVT